MSRRLLERTAALGAVALLALSVSLAVTARTRQQPAPLPSAEGAYTALAGSSGPSAFGKRSACGVVIRPSTVGISSPVLPCGVRLYVGYRGRHVLTEVIDRGPDGPGRQFVLTSGLARELGLAGVKRIEWSYAGGG